MNGIANVHALFCAPIYALMHVLTFLCQESEKIIYNIVYFDFFCGMSAFVCGIYVIPALIVLPYTSI